MKTDNQKKKRHIALATFAIILSFFTMTNVFPQAKIPLIKASSEKAGITDGAYCHVDWKSDPKADPDVYFVNIPTKESTVVFLKQIRRN
ncbi:Uncharacterised protein [Sphingobacterium multivorum]|uniref:Uncharacterized protein n=1 Tax=Sphingobacterium multivorum TaxID=28454 RepID=A0A2X2LPA8_SPHMU|nr:hypothetical protein [Sphingobacterium multivorum]SPZ94859.1 Uncharacterised protein [Sphingobacterium multivorum]